MIEETTKKTDLGNLKVGGVVNMGSMFLSATAFKVILF